MDIFQKIKDKNLKELMDATLGEGKKEGVNIMYKDPVTQEKTASLVYYSEEKGWFSFGPRKGGDILDFIMYVYNLNKGAAVKWFKATYQLTDDEEKQEQVKQPKHEDLWKNFNNYRLKEMHPILSKWLGIRGVQDRDKASEVLKEIGVFKQLFIKTDTHADVLIFPCYAANYHKMKLIGAKLRMADGSKFGKVKSKTITGSKTGLIYGDLDFSKPIYLFEGEADYVIGKILGFTNAVGNLGGAGANVKMIGKLLIEATEVVCFYDQDAMGLKGSKMISEELSCNVIIPKFPNQGKEKIDINDMYKKGFTYEDFLSMIENSKDSLKLETISDEVVKKEDGLYVYKTIQEVVKEVKVTNFFMNMKDILVYPGENGNEDKRSIRFQLISGSFKKTYEFKGREIVDARTFTGKIAEINPLLCTYNISSDSLQKLVRYLSEQNNKIKETVVITKKGYLSKYNIRVFDNGIYSETNKKFFKYTLEDELVCELPDIKILFKGDTRSNIKYEKDYYKESVLLQILSDSEYIFNGKQGHFVLGYFVSCLFFHKLKLELTPFPLLFVAGKKSSGKTTALQMFLQCFGFNHILPESFEKSTPFIDQSDISELSALPLWRDEYRNNTPCMKKDGFLKTVFDRSGISKGRIDLTKIHLPINAPLILSGEELPNDNAVFSRVCSINVKADRKNGSYEEIKARSDYYGTFLVYLLSNIDNLQKIYEEKLVLVKKLLIKQKVEKRLLNIYLPVIAGVASYGSMISGDYDINEDIVKDYLEIIQSKQKEEDDTDVINGFFNSLHISYQRYELYQSDGHITISGNKISINYPFLYSIYAANETRNRRDPVNQQSMKKYLISELCGTSTRFYAGGRQKRGMQITEDGKFEALTDLLNFLQTTDPDKKDDLNFNINKKK